MGCETHLNKKPNTYIPFGEEWEKEMMKFNKKQLIALFKKSCIDNLEYQDKFLNLNKL